ncbi:MAG TPA: lipoyl(octanoyl) transferase, partial [Myxococcales bacterium]|nr:lipoyl(octanoyl) transferase [Myxococcales bacterium]
MSRCRTIIGRWTARPLTDSCTEFASCSKRPSTPCEADLFLNGVGSRLSVEWLGRVAYSAGLELQAKAVEARRNGVAGDRLLLLEHPPVITLGRSAREANLLLSREMLADKRIDVHEVPRGGDVTYHAPGQLVGYLVVDLKARGETDVHLFLRRIEGALIESLEGCGLRARSVPGRTGVFIAEDAGSAKIPSRKIASIGVGLQHWIT